jgi:ADP-heptose:LPS heptosyltransferase
MREARGGPPVLDRQQVRPGLSSGRYLFFNPALRAVLFAVDAWGSVWRGRPRSQCDAQPRRILVSLQAHIGDVIIGTCVLPVLRAAFPQATLGFLTHPGSRVVLDDHPYVDRVHTFEHWKLNRRAIGLPQKLWQHWVARRRLIRELKAERYDLAVDLYAYFPNSIPLLAASGIPIRLGWTSGGFGPWLTHGLDWSEGRRHVVEWHVRLIGVLAACQPHLGLARPVLHAGDVARVAWKSTRTKHGVGEQYIVCHVGIGSPRRRWADREWRDLVAACADLNLPVLLMGQGEIDEQLCRRLAAEHAHAVDLAGTLAWPVMSVALSAARAVIGLDSMSSHVAAAWQVPTLCITTGLTDPIWRPFGSKTRVALTPTPCAPCYLPDGCPGMECIRMTRAGTVYTELKEMLHAP